MLTVRAYAGDGNVLLAWDIDPKLTANLAGFAIECKPGDGLSYIVPNRLSFKTSFTAETTAAQRQWTPSTEAPIQRFSWLDYLKSDSPEPYAYTVTAMHMAPDAAHLRAGEKASVTVSKDQWPFKNLLMGFTRGYLSSQAYAELFHNAPISPQPPSVGFDTGPYEAQYAWLGGHARRLLFDFLDECGSDPAISVDVFAYDFNEPDVIRALAKLGPRLRLFLDDAPLHTRPGALEPLARAMLAGSAGDVNVKTGHFQRFAHSKVMIQKKNGRAVKVLTGSANFALRGLYVQANNVLVFNDAAVAGIYEQAFEQAFTGMAGFASSPIAAQWLRFPAAAGRPAAQFAFSPHKSFHVSLDEVAQAIQNAESSVLFAIMELAGGGPVMDAIKQLGNRKIFTYGMTQTESSDLKIFSAGNPNGIVVPFAFLSRHVPEPFVAEWNGGFGQVIHHKFVVVDFNGKNPKVFTGSSNLSSGGEQDNGDNLIGFSDPALASRYAVEAIRLVDHYHFRAALKTATDQSPLTLSTGDWWKPYFDPANIQSHIKQVLLQNS
jgi:phosphatidylserine/phosphatidylglycerophosphate/cardiolipin synthase-like enzyme